MTRALSSPGFLASPSRCFDLRLPSPFHTGSHAPARTPHISPHRGASKPAPTPLLLHLHLLEAPHAVQDVKLLPALGKVHFAVNVIRVSQVNKGQVLQNQASGRGAAGQGVSKQVQRLVTQGRTASKTAATGNLVASRCCHHQRCSFKLEGNVPPAADLTGLQAQGAHHAQLRDPWGEAPTVTLRALRLRSHPPMGGRTRLEGGRKGKRLPGVKPSF